MLTAIDNVSWDYFVRKDLGLAIDVAEEMIESGDSLGEAAFDSFPFIAGDQARQQVVRENPFGTFVSTVDSECDALGEEGKIG